MSQYIVRHNKNVNIEDIKKYLEFFDLKEDVLKQKIERLSGGERMKCVIISAILKDTPYIFLDEPTNYVDNKTVDKIAQLLTEISKDRTIIIVTHDKRLSLEYNNVYEIRNNTIIPLNEDKNTKKNNKSLAKIKFKLGQIVEKIKINPINLIFLTLSTLSIIVAVNNFGDYIRHDYCLEENAKNDSIIVYNQQERGLKDYLKASNIKLEIEEDNILTFDNLEQVPEIKDIYTIVLPDGYYLNRILEAPDVEKKIIELPEEILLDNYIGVFGSYIQFPYCDMQEALLIGRYPKDSEKEICLSKQLVEQKFEKDCDYENLLNQYIKIEDSDYKIVGIVATDTSFVSFRHDTNFGFYAYNKATYKEFLQRNNLKGDEGVTCYISTKDGTEKQVLDTLIKKFSGSDYRSNVYYKAIASYNNKMLFIKKIIPQLAILGGILGYIFLFLQKQVFKKEERKLNDLINYYLEESKIKWVYLRNEISCLVAITFGTTSGYLLRQFKNNSIFKSGISKEKIWVFSIITIALLVLQLGPTVGFTIRKYRKWKC